MTIITSTKTVNAAFFREIKEVHQALWAQLDRLRGYAAAPIVPDEQMPSVIREVCDLQDMLAMHFALEEAFGYFDDPVSVAPHLSERANRLLSEHGELYLEIMNVADLGLRISSGQNISHEQIRKLMRRFVEFDEHFMRHEHAENELIMEAFGEDLGTGD